MELHNYQKEIVNFIKDKKKCAIYADMGMGKTAATLVAVAQLLEAKQVKKVLVIAPKRVVEHVWAKEAAIWASKLSIADIRLKQNRGSTADIHLINRERVVDLLSNSTFSYDCLILDEASSFKSYKSKRFKALRALVDKTSIPYIIELTAMPAPNSLEELWPQIYLLDRGQRLGRYITHFRNTFCYKENLYKYAFHKGAKEHIWKSIEDITFSLKAKSYLKLPELIINDVIISFPGYGEIDYKNLVRSFCHEEITAANAAVLAGKLLQFCNGFLYKGVAEEVIPVHQEKLFALEEIIQETEQNILVAYNFRQDLKALLAKFPFAVDIKEDGAIDRWNKGGIKMLLAHPASAGHGLNLQHGGNTIIWYGLTWSLELYEQLNGRIHRQGQKNTTIIHRIMMHDSIEQEVSDVLSQKKSLAVGLKNHLEKAKKALIKSL